MSTALTVFLVVVTVLLVLGAVAFALVAVWLGRHAVRAGRSGARGVRVGRQTLRARLPGPAQEVQVQRLRVERELAATAAAWADARRLDRRRLRPLAEHVAVLERTGRRLVVDLGVVAAEPDAWRRGQWLAEVRPTVDAFVRASGHLRQTVLYASDAYGDGAFARTAAVLAELAAVEHERVTGHREIGVLDALPAPVSLTKTPHLTG